MADKPIATNPTADIPQNWTDGQIVAPSGTSVGLTEKHGWNYIMSKINQALTLIGTLNDAWDAFKALAFKASASATYTPAGTVSKPTITVTPTTTSIGSASGWSAGTVPTLGTAIPADDITAWSAGSTSSIAVASGVLTFTQGTASSLSYTAKSIPNVTSVGTAPSLTVTSKTVVTDIDSATSTQPTFTGTQATITVS